MKRSTIAFVIMVLLTLLGSTSNFQASSDHGFEPILSQNYGIEIINPLNNSVVGDLVTIDVNITGVEDLQAYSLFINDTLVATTPEWYFWNTSEAIPGTYVIRAEATFSTTSISVKHVVTVDENFESGLVKIVDYNIWETGKDPRWKNVIKEENPDLVIAQETGGWSGPDDPNLIKIRNEFNEYFTGEQPYEVWATSKNPSVTAGEAVFSRYPILQGKTIFELTLDDGSIKKAHNPMLDVVIKMANTYVHVISIHLKCCDSGTGLEQKNREQDMEGLINYMDELGNVPIILAGDFNSFSPYDVGDIGPVPAPGNLGVGPISMLLFQNNTHASKQHQWMDVYRELNPYVPGYTYEDFQYKSRIDFIFVNQYFFNTLVNSTVAWTPSGKVGSDHYPVDATLNLDFTTRDLRPPVRVTGFKGELVNNSALQLTWNESPAVDFDHYNLYKNDSIIYSGNATAYLDTELQEKVIHVYYITAVDVNGNEGFRFYPIMVNKSYGILTVPTVYNLTTVSGDHFVKLMWQVDKGGLPVIEYRIYRGLSMEGPYVYYGSSTNETYLDDTTVNGRTYYYKVSGVNLLGEGEQSNIAIGNPVGAPKPPNPPLSLKAEVKEDGILLTWQEPSSNSGPITEYRVYRSTTSGGPYDLIATTTELSYLDKDVEVGKTYYYVVSAVNDIGEGPTSYEAKATFNPTGSTATGKTTAPLISILTAIFVTTFVLRKKKQLFN